MSERSSISLAEVLGENYYIDKLTSSDYSPSVGDTVTITLLVKDVFGDPASGQTRTVTCTGGQFVSVNGTSITASDSVNVTTSSSGTVTLGLSVSVADTITVSDGKADCVVCSLSTSIANLIKVQYVSLNFGSINSGANSTKTATVTACPSGYNTMIVPKIMSWCIVYSSSVSNTTLSVSVSNSSSIAHTCSAGVYVIYYPSSWDI